METKDEGKKFSGGSYQQKKINNIHSLRLSLREFRREENRLKCGILCLGEMRFILVSLEKNGRLKTMSQVGFSEK